jgi:hypothetical protein
LKPIPVFRQKGRREIDSEAAKSPSPRLELKPSIERAGKDGMHRKPIKKDSHQRSWLPSSLKRASNDQEHRQGKNRKRSVTTNPAEKLNYTPDEEKDIQNRGTHGARGRGRGRGRGGKGEHKAGGQQQTSSESPPAYPSRGSETRGRNRGRGGLRNSSDGNDSPGQQ